MSNISISREPGYSIAEESWASVGSVAVLVDFRRESNGHPLVIQYCRRLPTQRHRVQREKPYLIGLSGVGQRLPTRSQRAGSRLVELVSVVSAVIGRRAEPTSIAPVEVAAAR
jgi:hypothetical protein